MVYPGENISTLSGGVFNAGVDITGKIWEFNGSVGGGCTISLDGSKAKSAYVTGVLVKSVSPSNIKFFHVSFKVYATYSKTTLYRLPKTLKQYFKWDKGTYKSYRIKNKKISVKKEANYVKITSSNVESKVYSYKKISVKKCNIDNSSIKNYMLINIDES